MHVYMHTQSIHLYHTTQDFSKNRVAAIDISKTRKSLMPSWNFEGQSMFEMKMAASFIEFTS